MTSTGSVRLSWREWIAAQDRANVAAIRAGRRSSRDPMRPAPPTQPCTRCGEATRWHPAGAAVCVGCQLCQDVPK